MRNLATRVYEMLHRALPALPEPSVETAQQILRREREVRSRMRGMIDRRLGGQRIRVHGDFHLG